VEAGVRLLGAADTGLADHLAGLINSVYAVAENGLWRDGFTRTNPAEMAELIAAGRIAVAERAGDIAGTVEIEDIEGGATIFGMLAAAPEQRGAGVGRALLDFAEAHSRARGRRMMQLELLVPRGWEHPSKEFLKGWYGRRGYGVVRSAALDELYPHLAPMLACPCDLLVYEKPL
jgi:GNAT superfamily N-acetyltransferase